MKKILITGATDGLGLLAAQMIAKECHHLIIHGRNPQKLADAVKQISSPSLETIQCDLSDLSAVKEMATAIKEKHDHIDVLINNAGILKAPQTITKDGFDIRFAVNTIAPYILVKELLPIMNSMGRIVNLSSAAQAPVDLDALVGTKTGLSDMEAYSQSKLAIILWGQHLVYTKNEQTPTIISLNPGSLLATKMVKEGFNMDGKDSSIGGEIIMKCAIDPTMQKATGRYFDNDVGSFGPLHPEALDRDKCKNLVQAMDDLLA